MKKLYFIILITIHLQLNAQTHTCNWAYAPVGTGTFNAQVYCTALDLQENIIQAGKIYGIADMNPSPATGDTSYSFLGYNFYLSKTASNGQLIWIKYFKGFPNISSFGINNVLVNSQNEIIVLGNYYGMIDFDFSDNGIDTLRSHQPTYEDYFIAKYDSLGNYLWAKNIGDANEHSQVQTFTLLPNDAILVATNPIGTVDLDPSANVHNTLGGNANLVCYDTNGNYVWNNNISTTYSYGIGGKTLESDAIGNSYLCTVGYYELTVNKFSPTGSRIWDKKIGDFSNNARVNPQSMIVNETNGDFYIAGTFDGNVDFDPNAGTVYHWSSSFNYNDAFIAKYDSSMNLIWVNTYEGHISFGQFSIAFSNNDLVCVGKLTGSIDFGSGFVFTSSSLTPFYLKIDGLGTTLDAFSLNGSGTFNTINIASNLDLVTTGYLNGVTDMDPTTAVLNLIASNSFSFAAVYSSLTTNLSSKTANPLHVFPNPSTGSITITQENSVKQQVEIYNVVGQCIYKTSLTNQQTNIDLRKENNGIYFIKIGSTTYSGIHKLVIAK